MITRLRGAVGGRFLLIKNTLAVAAGAAITAVLGFVYWWLAARTLPARAVGGASAVISAMGLVGLFSEAGFGTLLAGETQRYRDRGAGLIWASIVASAGTSLLGAGLMLRVISDVGLGALGDLWFILGCAMTSTSLVLDQAAVGLMRASLQFSRNIVFSAGKLALLGGVALGVAQTATGIVSTWVIGLAVSIVWTVLVAARARLFRPRPPDFRLLFSLTGQLFGHHALNMAVQAPSLIMPLLVGVTLSPTINAAFYAGWMVLTIAAMVPGAMTLVLYTMGTSSPDYHGRLRFSVLLTAIFTVVTGLCFILMPRFILSIFNPSYPDLAGSSLPWFSLGLLGLGLKYHYLLLARLHRRIRKATVVFTIGAVLEVGLAFAGGWAGGLRGLTIGWVAGLLLETSTMLPSLRTAFQGKT